MFFKIVFCLLFFLVITNVPAYSEVEITENWMIIQPDSDDSRNVGYSHSRIEDDGMGINIYEKSKFNIKVSGHKDQIETKALFYIKQGSIQTFDYTVSSSSQNYKVVGSNENGKLVINTINKSNIYKSEYKHNKDFIVYTYLPKWLSDGRLIPGSEYQVYLFDPMMAVSNLPKRKFTAQISVHEKEIINVDSESYETYKVEVEFLESKSTIWITDDGQKIKELIPPEFVAIKSTQKKLSTLLIDDYDLSERTAVKSNVDISKPRKTEYMKFILEQLDKEKFYEDSIFIVDNYSQFINQGFYEVKRGNLDDLDPSKDISNNSYKNYLLPTNFVQSEDLRVIDLMNKITSKSNSKLDGVLAINKWVYKNIKKKPTFGVPNALDVLDTMVGDCNEHAVLFAALSRSYDVPTKIVLGLVYLKGKFYYHAWNEVFLGKWVTVDSSYGQLPADATHIKLLEGSIGRGPELLKMVGKLNIEILEVY